MTSSHITPFHMVFVSVGVGVTRTLCDHRQETG